MELVLLTKNLIYFFILISLMFYFGVAGSIYHYAIIKLNITGIAERFWLGVTIYISTPALLGLIIGEMLLTKFEKE